MCVISVRSLLISNSTLGAELGKTGKPEKHCTDIGKTISFSEPFLEATPQVHISLILLGFDGLWNFEPLVLASFAISIISAAFGIAKLLKNGPIKVVQKDGKMGGYATPGFILLMIAIEGNLVGKATWMALGFGRYVADEEVILIWALSCLLPQFLLVRLQNNCLFLSANICYQKK